MGKWFNCLPRLLQMLLLLIPGVNWVIEVLVRWDNAINRKSVVRILLALVVTIFGLVFGWLDFFWCLFFHHMILSGE